MNLGGGGVSGIPGAVDIKDPRIRITFADVAMRIAHDGPMYGVLTLLGILSMRKDIEGLHAIVGMALALQARSRPPETDKLDRVTKGLLGGSLILVTGVVSLGACQ
jgi:hypothetical protein